MINWVYEFQELVSQQMEGLSSFSFIFNLTIIIGWITRYSYITVKKFNVLIFFVEFNLLGDFVLSSQFSFQEVQFVSFFDSEISRGWDEIYCLNMIDILRFHGSPLGLFRVFGSFVILGRSLVVILETYGKLAFFQINIQPKLGIGLGI